MRALAMLGVFAMHATGFLILSGYVVEGSEFLVEAGRTGLALFFVLSGFLLYLPFAYSRLSRTPPPALKSYYLRRGLRIIPAYWVALLAFALWFEWSHVLSPEGVLTYFGFLQVYSGEALGRGIRQAWAVDVLVLFYVLLPLWAAMMRKIPSPSVRAFIRSEGAMLLALALVSVAWKVQAYRLLADLGGGYRPGEPVVVVLPAFLDYFAFGMGLAVAFLAVAARGSVPRAVKVIQRVPGLAWLGAGTGFYALVAFDPWATGGTLDASDDTLLLVAHGLTGLTVLAFLLPAVFGSPRRGLVTRFLANRALLSFGVVSYGFFLWHQVILGQLQPRLYSVGPIWYVAAALTLSLGAGAVSYYGVEKPVLRLGRDLPRQATATPKPAARAPLRMVPVLAPVLAGAALALVIAIPIAEVQSKADTVQAELVRRNGRPVIVSSWGTFHVVPAAVGGFIERFSSCGRAPVVEGWAADTARQRVAERVLILADDDLLIAGPPNRSRPDVARVRGRALGSSGFLLTASQDRAKQLAHDSRLRVFALVGRRALELRAAEGVSQVPWASPRLRARLVERNGHLVIISSSGTAPVVPNAVSGHIDSASGVGLSLVVGGWAADTANRRVAECLLMFADGRLLAAGPPDRSRPDVARIHGRTLRRSGFSLASPARRVKELVDSEVRVFAVASGVASELVLPPERR
jgi:peptidoglycan/LPS O-acetylase OafA/YrhL